MDTKIVPAYFYGKLGAVAYEEGTLVAVHDPWAKQCLAVNQENDTKEDDIQEARQAAQKGSRLQASAAARQESRSWLSKLLWGSSSPATLSGCAYDPGTNAVCQSSSLPIFDPYSNSMPATINEENLTAGVDVQWRLNAANCDGSVDGIKLSCYFSYRDGSEETVEYRPDSDGKINIKKTLTKEFDRPPQCDLYYINPNDSGTQLKAERPITLYGPAVIPAPTDTTPDDTCYSVPEPGAGGYTPIISKIVNGDNTTFTWTLNDLTDCNGDPLVMISDNASDLLDSPLVNYSGTTLTVTGQVLPNVSGALRVTFDDNDSNTKIVNLYLPQVEALKLEVSDPYIEQDESVDFYSQAVPGAVNYQFTVTNPDSTTQVFNQPDEYLTFTPTQAGPHHLKLEVQAYNSSTVFANMSFNVNAVSSTPSATCYSIPDPGASSMSPTLSQIVQGDGTSFTWTVSGLVDCFGSALTKTTDNTSSLLHGASAAYDTTSKTLTVTGQVLPTVSGGTLQVYFEDSYGHTKIVNLYPPAVKPLQVLTTAPYIQVGDSVPFSLLQQPYGASNYKVWVTKPDSTDDPFSNLLNSNYSYTPAVAGTHTVKYDITTFNSTVISTSLPFGVNSVSSSTPTCYTIPDPGAMTQSPLTSTIIRGDNTLFTFTVNNVTDCLGDPLSLYSNNASTILYDQAVSYASNTLSVTGRMRSSITGGTVQVTMMDSWGHTKIVNIYPPAITEPQIVIVDPYIQISESLALQLLAAPNGVTYNYTITRPDFSTFSSGTLSSSSYTVPSGQKSQIGTYSIDLAISAGDSYTFHVPGSFAVNAD